MPNHHSLCPRQIALLLGCLWPVIAQAGQPAPLDNWPVFRGDPGLRGCADVKLPDRLSMLWTFKSEGKIKSSPVVANGLVYVGSGDGRLYALRLDNGHKQWEFKAADAIEAPPMTVGGRVYVGCLQGTFYAVDAATGKPLWQFETEGKIAGSANWIETTNGIPSAVLVGSYDNKLYCLDARTGKSLWTVTTDNYINGSPSVGEGKAIFGGCDGLLHIVSAKDGTKLGEIEAGSYIAGSAALERNQAFFGHYGNQLVCADLEKKTQLWSYGKADGGAPFFSSPAVNQDRVVIGGRDGFLHCVERQTGKLLWTFRAREDVDSSPVICRDKVVVGSNDGRLYLLKLADGSLVWNYEIGAPIQSSPAITSSGHIVIGAEDGRIYALGPKP